MKLLRSPEFIIPGLIKLQIRRAERKEGGREEEKEGGWVGEEGEKGGKQEGKTGHSYILTLQLNHLSLPKSQILGSINTQFHIMWTPTQF